jgi:hypothetical protein
MLYIHSVLFLYGVILIIGDCNHFLTLSIVVLLPDAEHNNKSLYNNLTPAQ